MDVQRSGESPRRHHSEIDMSSLRRISEALLLAQNRARLATERANRCERYELVALRLNGFIVLRMVLSQVNPQLALSMRSELDAGAAMQRGGGLLIDTISDWDMMASMAQQSGLELSPEQQQRNAGSARSLTSTILSSASPPHRRHSFDIRGIVDEEGENNSSSGDDSGNNFESNSPLWASMVAPERNLDVALLAKEIVENLRIAAVRGDQRVQKLNEAMPSGKNFVAGGHENTVFRKQQHHRAAVPSAAEKNWLETWKHRLFRIEIYAMSPLQFVTGILVGVVVGMTVTKQLMLRHQGGSSSQLVKRLASCYKRRIGASSSAAAAAALAGTGDASFLPFAMDDDVSNYYGYYVHPTAVEVA